MTVTMLAKLASRFGNNFDGKRNTWPCPLQFVFSVGPIETSED